MDVSQLISQEAEKIAQTQETIIWVVIQYLGTEVTIEGSRRTLIEAQNLANSVAPNKKGLKWVKTSSKKGDVYVAAAEDSVQWALVASVLA